MTLSDILTYLSIGRIVVQAFLYFALLQLWVSIMLVLIVFIPSHDPSFKWDAALHDFVHVPDYFIYLNVLAVCATIATLQIVVSIALLPFTRASEPVHRAFYRVNGAFTSVILFSVLSGTCYLLPTTRIERPTFENTWWNPAGRPWTRSWSAVVCTDCFSFAP